MTASINRLSCDKYTGANITNPLLPMERGGLSFIKTRGQRSHAQWLEWAKSTHPDNEGDVLIQALLCSSVCCAIVGLLVFQRAKIRWKLLMHLGQGTTGVPKT